MIHPVLQNVLTVFQACLTASSKSVWIGNIRTIKGSFPFLAVKSSSLPLLLHSEVGRLRQLSAGGFWGFPVLCPLLPWRLWNSQASVLSLHHAPPACWRNSLSQQGFTRGKREVLCVGIPDKKVPEEQRIWLVLGRGERQATTGFPFFSSASVYCSYHATYVGCISG